MMDFEYYERRIHKMEKCYKGCFFSFIGTVILLIILLIILLLTGCKHTEYVPVETVKHEHVWIHDTLQVNDSTVRNDSTTTVTQSLLQKVDSAYLALLGIINAPPEAWLLQVNTTTNHISNNSSNHKEKEVAQKDSVRTEIKEVPYPVEKKLTRWQQICIDYGKIMFGATVLLVIFVIVWIARRLGKRFHNV